MTDKYGNLELHTVLLSAMKDIDKVCRENGLKYFLHAGTLLGAINFKGFIPWDDDVDISLFRDDYEKLLELLQRDYADKYFVQNYKTDPEYPNNRTVLRVLGTSVEHFHEKDVKHREIGVDIVPLDSAPNTKLFRWLQEKRIYVWDIALQIKLGEIQPQSPVTKLISILSRRDRLSLGEKIDKIAKSKKGKSKYVGLLTYTGRNPYTGKSGYDNDLRLRSRYETVVDVEFEGELFMSVAEIEDELNYRYGLHWAEPYPEEKRITKHDVKSYEISDEVRKRVGLL